MPVVTKKKIKVKAVPNHPGFKVSIAGYEGTLLARSSFSDIKMRVKEKLAALGVAKPFIVEITVVYEEK